MQPSWWKERELLLGSALIRTQQLYPNLFVQVFVKGKVIRLVFGSSLQLWRRSRSEYGGCDLSQVSLPRLEEPKSIIGQKLGCIMYCRKAETEKGGNASVCVCVHLSVSTVLSITPFEIRAPPPRSWQQ